MTFIDTEWQDNIAHHKRITRLLKVHFIMSIYHMYLFDIYSNMCTYVKSCHVLYQHVFLPFHRIQCVTQTLHSGNGFWVFTTWLSSISYSSGMTGLLTYGSLMIRMPEWPLIFHFSLFFSNGNIRSLPTGFWKDIAQ